MSLFWQLLKVWFHPDPLPPLVTMSLNMTFFYLEVVPKGERWLIKDIWWIKYFFMQSLSFFHSWLAWTLHPIILCMEDLQVYYFNNIFLYNPKSTLIFLSIIFSIIGEVINYLVSVPSLRGCHDACEADRRCCCYSHNSSGPSHPAHNTCLLYSSQAWLNILNIIL